jgi:serine/threonine protein kinase
LARLSTALFAGRYETIGVPLGRGVFGTVWRARDHNLDVEVALKLFRRGAPVIHAYGEARLLILLAGDQILPVLNADIADDIPFIATRVAALGSTEDEMTRTWPRGVPPDRAVTWMRQALVGLGSTHGHRLLHRDIKPANIFLDDLDHAMLGDFGVAALMDGAGRATAHGDLLVRPPEMIQHNLADVRSDIYSAGVTLYRLLSGHWPFAGATDPELAEAIIAGRPPRLRDLAPHVSKRLAARVERAMAPDPARRYESAAQMHAALAQHDLAPRSWRRVDFHTGHPGCWLDGDAGKEAVLGVCVVDGGDGTFSIDTHRVTGAKTHLRDYCFQGAKPGELAKVLRSVFDDL